MLVKKIHSKYFYWVIERIPLSLWHTLAYINGILWDRYPYIFIVLILLVELIYQSHKIPRLYATGLLFTCFFLGSLNITHREKKFLHYEHLVSSKVISLTGVVTTAFYNGKETQITLCIQSCFELPETKGAQIKINIPGNYTAIPGNTLQLSSIFLQTPENYHKKKALHKSNIIATSRIKSHSQITVLPTASWWQKKRHAIKNQLIENIQRDLSPQAASLFTTLFLGYPLSHSSYLETRSLFERWGISHYLARSGLHIMIILSLLNVFFMCIPVHITTKNLCSMFFSIFYALVSFPTLSFMRALLTALWYSLCIQKYIATHSLHIFSLVTFSLLLYQPLFLFSIDFQLSFGLTYILLFISLCEVVSRKTQISND